MMRIIFLGLSLVVFMAMSAQKTKTVEGEYTYYAPENVSLAEARRIALERAMNEALATEFGTIVSQSNSTIIKNNNDNSSTEFFSLGGSEVKGEWLRTIGEPEYQTDYNEGTLVVKVKVKGEAREITNVPINLDVKVLRNGLEPRFEDVNFKNNDDIFLYFKSPENGYLAVFLLDEETTDVSCLLPYQNSTLSSVPIKRGKPYVFFSEKTCDKEELEFIENYCMTCTKEVEHNSLYVVFSPKKFSTPVLEKEYQEVLCMPYKDFNKWLTALRIHDKEINIKAFNLKIEK